MILNEYFDAQGNYVSEYDSSNIKKSYYDLSTQTLMITFNSGATYSYEPVLPYMVQQFKLAESQGKYFIANIKSDPRIKVTKLT